MKIITCIFWVFLIKTTALFCQHSYLKNDQIIPFDPECKYGQLKNGFTYYIKQDESTKDKIILKLVVKAGLEHEEPDQYEYAHLLEHMAFVQTKSLKNVKDEVKTWGVDFGPALNGSTNYKYTDYILVLPTTNKDIFRKALQLVRDWAQGGIVMGPSKIANERKVVLQERGSAFVNAKLGEFKAYSELLFDSKKYIDRYAFDIRPNLIGGANEPLLRFYKDWYKPEMESLIIVGDLNIEEAWADVEKLFSDMSSPIQDKVARDKFAIEKNGKHNLRTFIHPDIRKTQMKIFFKDVFEPQVVLNDYKCDLARTIVERVFAGRIKDIQLQSKDPDTELISLHYSGNGSSDLFLVGDPFRLWTLDVETDGVKLKSNFYNLMIELLRLKKFGLTERELFDAKNYLIEENKKYPQQEIWTSVQQYQLHFLFGEASPRIVYRDSVYKELTKEIAMSDINREIAKLDISGNRNIMILAAEKDGKYVPDDSLVNCWVNEILSADIKPFVYKHESVPEYLMNKEYAKKLPDLEIKSVKKSIFEKINVSKIELHNGVTVLFKKSEEPNRKETKLIGIKNGGSYGYSDEDYINAYVAPGVVSHSGIGVSKNYKVTNLFLDREDIRILCSIRNNESIVEVSSKDEDGFEKSMQLLHLYFTTPEMDTSVLDISLKYYLENIEQLNENIRDPVRKLTREKLLKVDGERMLNIFKENFSHPNNYTFFISSELELDILLPYIGKYLGSLPAGTNLNSSTVSLSDVLPSQKEGVVKNKYVDNYTNDKASFNLMFSKECEFEIPEMVKVDILGNILHTMALRRLRNEDGFSYTTSGSGALSKENGSNFSAGFGIYGDCQVNMIDKAIEAACEEISKLKANGPSLSDLAGAKIKTKNNFHSLLKEGNSNRTLWFWSSYLLDCDKNGRGYYEILNYQEIIDKVDAESIRQLAVKFLRKENCTTYRTFSDTLKPIR